MRIFTFIILLLSSFYTQASSYSTMQFKNAVRIMSFNIRYDNPADKPNDWPNRRDWVGELIKFYEPDFVGAQEVQHNQLMDMLQRLPDYAYLGVGREDGKTAGEYCPLFYLKSKYEVVKSATFWLAETPEQPVKGWDALLNRIVTWGEFKDKKSGKTFFVFNTHFDHVGGKAREESAKLLLAKVKEIAGNRQAIITGDFNSHPESVSYKFLVNGDEKNKGFLDVYKLAKIPYGPEWTTNAFGKSPVERRRRIDYIFVNQNVAVNKYISIAEQRGDLFPSDHLPIMAEIMFK